MQTAPRDLTTPRDRPTYALDRGLVLETRSPYDLTIEEFEQVESLYLRMGALLVTRRRTPEQVTERQRVVSAICTIATGDADAYAALGDVRAMVICNDFMDLCAPIVRSLQTSRVTPEASPSPSPNSSPTSVASTRAPRRATGRAKRR